MKKIITICSIFLATLQLHAQGTIIPNGITCSYHISSWSSTTSVYIMHNNGYAQVDIAMFGDFSTNLFVGAVIAGDSDARVFSFQANDLFTLQGIQSGDYIELTSSPWSGFNMTCEENDPFYLGFYTGSPSGTAGIFSDPVLGWGLFENVGGIIKMIDSGLESGGDGIIVGTLGLVPEPSTCALVLFGLAGFLGYRKRLKNP